MAGKVTSLEGKVPKSPPPLQVVSIDGASASFLGVKAERYNPDLLAARKGGLGIYKKMLQDEQVKAVMKFRRDSIIGRGHEFVFEDTELSEDEQKLRTKVMSETLRRMNGSFADAVVGILTGMAYGFSVSEMVTQIIKIDNAPYVGLADVLLRDPESFKFYTDDYGTLTRMVQRINAQEIELDPVRFLHYVQNPEVDPYYGESELRAAYRPWFFKDMDLKLWAAYKERMAGGFLSIELGTSGIIPGSNDYLELTRVLSNMRSTMGVLLPNGVTATMHSPASTDVFEKAITTHDLAIAKSLLVPNLLGMSQAGQTGSYSQSQTQLETYFMTLATDTQRLEQCLNDQLFRVLAMQNWDDGEFPRFRFKKASAEHVKWVVESVVALAGAGGLILTPKDEAHLRQLLDLAPRDESQDAMAKVKQDMVPIQEDPNKLAAIAAKADAAPAGKAAFSEWDESKHPRHASGDDRGGEFASSSSSAGPWEDKATADSEWSKGRGWVARGLANVLPENDLPIALAEKIAAGEANANDILGIIDQESLGSFWYGLNNTADGGSMSDVESFAYTEDSFGSKFADASFADAKATGENAIIPTSVVLVAKRPKGWSPDENPDNGLMGNSYIDRKSVRLEAVRYKSAKGWVTKRVSKTVNLSSAEQRKQFSLDRALQRVDFAVIAQRALGIEEDVADKLANLAAKTVSQQLTDERLTALLGPDVDTIGQVRIDDAGIGKIKAAFKDGLSRAWALGLNQAMTETAKARKATFSKSDRQAHFAALRENAADWFESNAFRMAGNFTDGMRAIIQQELLQAVKTGLRPEPAAARIFTRLIERGFMTLDAVHANETRDQVLELVTEALRESIGTANVAAYLNTLVRTNTFEALNEARYAEFTDPAVADFVEALQYSAILDDRTTPICRELDGHVHAVGSKVWEKYRPPNHYNCRSVVFAVTKLDGWDGQESPEPTVEPQEGFK